jgi:hypothetical protein
MPQFTIIFPDRQGQGRVGRCRLPWVKGKELRTYLKESPLKELGLLGFSLRCKLYNSKKQIVRTTYAPFADDFVIFNSTKG